MKIPSSTRPHPRFLYFTRLKLYATQNNNITKGEHDNVRISEEDENQFTEYKRATHELTRVGEKGIPTNRTWKKEITRTCGVGPSDYVFEHMTRMGGGTALATGRRGWGRFALRTWQGLWAYLCSLSAKGDLQRWGNRRECSAKWSRKRFWLESATKIINSDE